MGLTLWLVFLLLGSAAAGASSKPAVLSAPALRDDPGVWVTVSRNGLEYLKHVLLTDVLAHKIPSVLPDVSRSVDVPFLGHVNALFTNITLLSAQVLNSTFALGADGFTLEALSVHSIELDWLYAYRIGWFPIPISDQGKANIEVIGMQVGLSVKVQKRNGSLQLTTIQCGTFIEDLKVEVVGDTSWIYQWVVDVMEDVIKAAVEDQLRGQIESEVEDLNSFVYGLDKVVKVDENADLNFTIVDGPLFGPTSMSIGLKGDFVRHTAITDSILKQVPYMRPGLMCSSDMAMVTITLSEMLLNSAAVVYYNAGLLNWLVDTIPDQSLLNTSRWRYLIPQLYQQYPDKGIRLNFEVQSPPSVNVTYDGLEGSVLAHLTIEVIDDMDIVPVACMSIAASIVGRASISGSNITGQVGLNDFSLSLEWSEVGNIHLMLIKVFIQTLLKVVLTPLLNLSLKRGFPLPVLPYVELEGATLEYGYKFLHVCTDVKYTGI